MSFQAGFSGNVRKVIFGAGIEIIAAVKHPMTFKPSAMMSLGWHNTNSRGKWRRAYGSDLEIIVVGIIGCLRRRIIPANTLIGGNVTGTQQVAFVDICEPYIRVHIKAEWAEIIALQTGECWVVTDTMTVIVTSALKVRDVTHGDEGF
jgi:hypothetical protein